MNSTLEQLCRKNVGGHPRENAGQVFAYGLWSLNPEKQESQQDQD